MLKSPAGTTMNDDFSLCQPPLLNASNEWRHFSKSMGGLSNLWRWSKST